jgi:hypothetical protein
MRISRRAIVGLLASMGTTIAMLPAATGAQAQNMAVPNYIYPPWTQMDAGARVVSVSVMNPSSGPGRRSDPQYVGAVKTAQAVGIKVLGYVWTNYGARSLSAVESDINSYYSWYKVDGIFLDGAPTNCAQESYYATLNVYVKAKGGLGRVIINPGEQTNSCYTAAADTIVNFEGSYNQYVRSYSAPSWVASAPASKFWHIIYNTSAANLSQAVALSKARNAGYVYVTPYDPPNPYGELPSGSYWSNELADIG